MSEREKTYRSLILSLVNSLFTICEPKGITDLVMIYIHTPKLVNLVISSITIRHVKPTLQKAIDYEQKIEKEFLLFIGIHQTEFDMVMLMLLLVEMILWGHRD